MRAMRLFEQTTHPSQNSLVKLTAWSGPPGAIAGLVAERTGLAIHRAMRSPEQGLHDASHNRIIRQSEKTRSASFVCWLRRIP
jgi:hypothetical protein